MTNENINFETEECSRCGGSGSHSYCQKFGSVCFKCGGSGKMFTVRGAAAKVFYEGQMSVSAFDIKVNNIIRVSAFNTYFAKVSKIEEHETYLDIHTVSEKFGNLVMGMVGKDSKIRRGWSAEEKAAFKAKALEYQATLTKAGTPRKRGA